jgi:hypothetical protein
MRTHLLEVDSTFLAVYWLRVQVLLTRTQKYFQFQFRADWKVSFISPNRMNDQFEAGPKSEQNTFQGDPPNR